MLNSFRLQNFWLLQLDTFGLTLAEPLLPHPLVDVVHAGHNDQSQYGREDQTENNGPGQDIPEHCAVATDDDMRVEVTEQAYEVDGQTKASGIRPSTAAEAVSSTGLGELPRPR